MLNDIYMQVINGAMTRPLDYDYLKSLPPAPQRFYELLSYQMYATIKNDRPRAKLLYSEFCTYAPMVQAIRLGQRPAADWPRFTPRTRYPAISPTSTMSRRSMMTASPDWIMLYQPGLKARAEYRAFAKRGGPVMLEAEPFTPDPLPQLVAPEASPLDAELVKRGVTEAVADRPRGAAPGRGHSSIRSKSSTG